jgi:zinc and cadmium transporter
MTSAIVFGMIAAGVALLALILVQRAAGFTRRNGPLAAAFAGGLVITIAVTHLIPEALVMAPNAPWLVLGGFAFGFVVHTLLGGAGHNHHDGETPAPNRIAALAPVIAIAMHSALDGLIYSVTFAVDSATGLIAATGLIIHEFPEALICFVLLQRAGLPNGRAALFAFLASGATTFTAAAISAPFAGSLDPETLGVLFALVAGLLLHVGAAHLIHEAAEAGALRGGGAVFAGAGVAALMALGHSHNHGHDHDHAHDGHHHHDHDPAEIHSDHDADHDHGHDHGHDHEHPHF